MINGTELLVRKEPRTFSRAVIDVLENHDLVETLSKYAPELIKQQYIWESGGKLLNGQIDQVLSTRHQRSSKTNITNDEIQ